MKKAIIVGSSSGIGRELAVQLHARGWTVGVTGRRTELLERLQQELGERIVLRSFDVARIESARAELQELLESLQDVELIVLSAGTGHLNPDLAWNLEEETIQVNAMGFAALAGVAYQYFAQRGGGALVGISSIACLMGNGVSPAYNASKAFASNYMDGLRQKAFKARLPIVVTDVRPGFVDTAMAKGPGQFWVAPPAKAASQILRAVERRRSVVYVTRRWTLIARLLQIFPEPILRRLG